MRNFNQYNCLVLVLCVAVTFNFPSLAKDNESKRAQHKLFVPPTKKALTPSQVVIPYQNRQAKMSTLPVTYNNNANSKNDANPNPKSKAKMVNRDQRPFRFAIQLGFFRDKKSVWRFMSSKGLTGSDFHTIATNRGFVLLFGRYQTFEMASIVWEQMVFEYQDSFIVNL